MENAAFATGLSKSDLEEIGRLAVNAGMAEFILELHLRMLFELNDLNAQRSLISPLSTSRKIEIMEEGLSNILTLTVRKLVAEGCKNMKAAQRVRNDILHGFWGIDAHSHLSVSLSTKKAKGHRKIADVSRAADQLALATRSFVNAIKVDGGDDLTTEWPEDFLIETLINDSSSEAGSSSRNPRRPG